MASIFRSSLLVVWGCILPMMGVSQQLLTLVSPLSATLSETSGLIRIDSLWFTHNDSGGASKLFQFDPETGQVTREIIVGNALNRDWEDLCHDSAFVYIGDFGNNQGSRTDLRIFRVPLLDVLDINQDTVWADTLNFSYADQVDFTPTSYSTNYDAEAMISRGDSLFIFTKNWGDQQSRVYALPKTPGDYSLNPIDTLAIQGLVTGASYDEEWGTLGLIGYAFTGAFFAEAEWIGSQLVSESALTMEVANTPGGYSFQIEGIAHTDSGTYLITAESGLSGAGAVYEWPPATITSHAPLLDDPIRIFPNPASHAFEVVFSDFGRMELRDLKGRLVAESDLPTLDIGQIPAGIYLITIWSVRGQTLGTYPLVIEGSN
ncbi:T9SS type A sorting domain-containing protein [Pontibacter sp. G13]|uniref:T9SS type A sorting domain-containing protein n=1 Tax=Pontibacter sp. G13 TaxID=3074898 RepID=UPI0028899655|nr:T9SS type A sorting domain-containing protein [Pontibacter sp. G13]WNJ18402.1 T9SS type A sorting domain-containing protein [Pontibacter sp. G13]